MSFNSIELSMLYVTLRSDNVKFISLITFDNNNQNSRFRMCVNRYLTH